MSTLYRRSVVVVFLPIALVAAFIGTLAREFRGAFHFAANAAGQEIAAARRHWRQW